jgi:GT2 family glycosyltransferase
MISSDRPPFILVISSDNQGCSYHRLQLPLGLLAASNLAEGRIEMGHWPDDLLAAVNPDVIVWQRAVEDHQFDHMRRYRRLLPNALFVYELDDHLGAVPPASFHAGYIPPHLPERVGQGLSLCDRATTTTEPLAQWLRTLSDTPVLVVPNAVPMARLKERAPRLSGKLRIGWAGGISHAGDLELLRPAMEAIGEEVQWVFMGMQPTDPPCRVQFHPGTSPHQYLDALLSLDLDLALAPLEDNVFNRCKSNLRLLESACIGVPVIAQASLPYGDGAPPVFSYADTPTDWTDAIRSFIAASPAQRDTSARNLRAWAGRHHTLEGTRQARLEAWTTVPASTSSARRRWSPAPPVIGGAGHDSFVVACPGGVDRSALPTFMRTLKSHRFHDSLTSACQASLRSGANVLWLRPGTGIDETGWNRLSACLTGTNQQGEAIVASATPLSSDGANAFPHPSQYVVVTPQSEAAIRRIAARRMVGRTLRVAAPSGPCVLLSATALAAFGIPDPSGIGDEAALLEWGLRLIPKGMAHVQAPDAYCASLAPPAPLSPLANLRIQGRGHAQYAQTPPEPLLPDDREAMELALLREQWAGPKPGIMGFDNDYATWSALKGDPVVTGGPPDGTHSLFIRRVVFGQPVRDDVKWLVFVDTDVTLRTYAVAVLMQAIRRAPPGVRVVYADHDMPQGGKPTPDFKPDFDLELFLARDYITPVCAVRADSFSKPPTDRADLFRIVLSIAATPGVGRDAFAHVPTVLATVADGESPEVKAMYALQRQIAVQEYYGAGVTVEARRDLPGALKVVHQWRSATMQDAPLVSIIIPTLGKGRLIQPCINTIRSLTAYPNWEIVVVHNGPLAEPELGDGILADPRVRVIRWDPPSGGTFNWSIACNIGARYAGNTGTSFARDNYYCFLNDDVCVASRDWLDAMLGHAVRPSTGAVGARLLHPMGVYQHVGVICHEGIAGHLHKGLPLGNPGYWGIATLTHECSAVTGACLLVSRDNFDLVQGFSEAFPLNYGDVDFCLRLRKRNRINITEAAAELVHPEGTTRSEGVDFTDYEVIRSLAQDNARLAALHPGPDPYWNPNLAIGMVQGGINIQGLNCDALSWPQTAPSPEAPRVLLLNDLPGMAGRVLETVRSGGVPFVADLSGFHIRLVAPSAVNTPLWDVRDPARLASGLAALGITRVVLRSLVGSAGAAAPVETLRCLTTIRDAHRIEVVVDAIDDLTVAPWLEPVRSNDSRTFGLVDTIAWHWAYEALVPAGFQQQQQSDQEAAQ